MKNLLTGLFRAARKRTMTTDNDMGMFRDKLNELVAQKDSLSDEEIIAKVDELKGFTNDLPSDDDKAKLDRFLEDFKAIKDQDEATAKEAAGMVADLFEKLDTAAMQDVPAAAEPAAEEGPAAEETEVVEETTEEEPAADEAPTTEEVVEETVAPEGEADDAEPGDNAEYTAEELYQFMKERLLEDEEVLEFIKKRLLGDAACGDEAPAEEVIEEEKEEVVTDHAPHIPVTMNQKSAAGSLGAMFAGIKRGER